MVYRRRFRRRRRFTPRRRAFVRRRRAFIRSRRRRPRILRFPRSSFPNQLIVTLPYVDSRTYSLTSVNGHDNYHSWRANGAYDPSFTGTGHQPMGWDQYTAIYTDYTVIRSCVAAVFQLDNIENDNSQIICGIGINTAQNGQALNYESTNAERRMELPQTVHRMIGSEAAASNATIKLKMNYVAHKYWRSSPFTDSEQSCSVSTVPNKQALITVWASNMVGGLLETDTVTVLTKIWYTVLFREARALTQS